MSGELFQVEFVDETNAVIRMHGEIDTARGSELDAAFDAAAETGVLQLVVDLGDVRFADSRLLRVLCAWYDTVRQRHGSVTVINAQPAVDRLLMVARQNGLLPGNFVWTRTRASVEAVRTPDPTEP